MHKYHSVSETNFFFFLFTYNTEWSLHELQSTQASLVSRSAARWPESSSKLHCEPDNHQDLHAEQNVDGVLFVLLDGGKHTERQAGEHHQESLGNEQSQIIVM